MLYSTNKGNLFSSLSGARSICKYNFRAQTRPQTATSRVEQSWWSATLYRRLPQKAIRHNRAWKRCVDQQVLSLTIHSLPETHNPLLIPDPWWLVISTPSGIVCGIITEITLDVGSLVGISTIMPILNLCTCTRLWTIPVTVLCPHSTILAGSLTYPTLSHAKLRTSS